MSFEVITEREGIRYPHFRAATPVLISHVTQERLHYIIIYVVIVIMQKTLLGIKFVGNAHMVKVD